MNSITTTLNLNPVSTPNSDPSLEEIVRLTFSPSALADRIPYTGSLRAPALFMLTVTLIPLTLMGLGLLAVNAGTASILELVVALPLVTVIFFIVSAYMHVFCKLFGGKGNYNATTRALAYTSFVNLLGAIPIIGFPLSFYGIYVQANVLKRAHQMSAARTWLCLFCSLIIPAVAAVYAYSRIH